MFISGFFKFMITGIAIVIVFGATLFSGAVFSKDKILDTYNNIVQTFSSSGISKDKDLKGNREFGIDKYVGTYKSNYENYTNKEVVFGGTSLKRENGDTIRVKIKVERKKGNINITKTLGNNEISLISDTGEYEDNIYVDGQSYYLTIKLDDFTGNIEIVAE